MARYICVFGDSISLGAVDFEKGGWATRLRDYFRKSDFNIDVYNCSVSGDNTELLLERFSTECSSRKPGIIIFAIGLNDVFLDKSEDRADIADERFKGNIQELIDNAGRFSSQIVFIGLTPIDKSRIELLPWTDIVLPDESDVSLYNEAIKEICGENGLLFVNMLDLLDKDDICEDGVHPNSRGHEKMFLRVKKCLVDSNIVKR